MSETLSKKDEVINIIKEKKIRFIKLIFTDINGTARTIEISHESFIEAINGKKLFSYQGIEESDMFLLPDLSTFSIVPWMEHDRVTALIICNIHSPDGSPFGECTRSILKKNINTLNDMGVEMKIGTESEFFLFPVDEKGRPFIDIHDNGEYMDVAPLDKGEKIRREIVETMETMGLKFENSHHEMSQGQHEINFSPSDPLKGADNFVIFRIIVRTIAAKNGCHATFMPKPVQFRRGSGLHIHQSIYKDGKNVFYDSLNKYGLSDICLHYIGGLIHYAREYTAVTNPLVNSYKRLVLYNAAPVYVTWAEKKRTTMVRIPPFRDEHTRIELRSPDPSCNPYMAFSVILKAGLTGIKSKIEPPPPCLESIYNLTQEYINKMKINTLPATLFEALQEMSRSFMVNSALGGDLFQTFIRKKFDEWNRYNEWIHPWELDNYLERF